MYLEIPLNAVVNFDGFYLGAGPYLGYAISGKYKAKYTGTGEEDSSLEKDLKIGNNKDEIKPLDFGLNAMAGYKLTNGLNFGLNYGLGLANTGAEGNNDYKASNRVISFLVGFSF